MRVIKFDKNKLEDEVRTNEKPVIKVINLVFSTNDANWAHRINLTLLKLGTTCYDINNQKICGGSQELSISNYIKLNQKQPVLKINYSETFENVIYKDEASYFLTRIEMLKIDMLDDESMQLTVQYT